MFDCHALQQATRASRGARRLPLRVLLAVSIAVSLAAGAAGLAGCTGSGSPAPGGNATGSNGMTMGAAGMFSAGKLRAALLTRVNGVAAKGAAQAGSYSSLPQVRQAAKAMAALLVTPKGCGQPASVGGTGLDGVLGGAPAAVVTFQVGANGVSEVLAAPADSAAAAALSTHIRAGCTHYRATTSGQTRQYTVAQSWVTGIGVQARLLSVSPAGQPGATVWSLVYRGDGFIGAVTVVGPNASKSAVRELGQQAYAYAAKTLHM
jgi:hypothetical protein